ncbi:putative lipopolysaccharide heptosyltransferase III, partial [candidate division KSB1 bacterium]|nr:putative lipopolysaccharide heptosyltransferase III [candidate division KSB1 bacterium]
MMTTKIINKILVIKLRAIGDVVMSTVVLDNLQAHFPHASIDFLTEAFCRDLVSDHPAVRRVWVLDKSGWRRQSWRTRLFQPIRLLSSIRREGYDAV